MPCVSHSASFFIQPRMDEYKKRQTISTNTKKTDHQCQYKKVVCQQRPDSLQATFLVVRQVLTRDSVTVAVDAVVYYRVQNATMSITNVEDANRSTRLLAATTLRNVLGTKNLAEILSERESISHLMQVRMAGRG